MFRHRQKTIGKSIYSITECNGYYLIVEIYNNIEAAKSPYMHYYVDDAIQELNNISTERYYTDNTRYFCF